MNRRNERTSEGWTDGPLESVLSFFLSFFLYWLAVRRGRKDDKLAGGEEKVERISTSCLAFLKNLVVIGDGGQLAGRVDGEGGRESMHA